MIPPSLLASAGALVGTDRKPRPFDDLPNQEIAMLTPTYDLYQLLSDERQRQFRREAELHRQIQLATVPTGRVPTVRRVIGQRLVRLGQAIAGVTVVEPLVVERQPADCRT